MFGLGGVVGNLTTGNIPERKLTQYLFYTFLLLFITIVLFVTVLHVTVLAFIISLCSALVHLELHHCLIV